MAKIVGTPGDDILKGTKGKDVIKGKGGNDIIIGKGGNDILKGGKGNDLLKGGSGDDKLKAGKGDDLLKGAKGDDVLICGTGVDDAWGGGGFDIFKFKRGDGLWPEYPNPAIERVDNIVWDYEDGIDKFDIPNADLGGPLIDNINYIDPVGGSGAVFAFGEESVLPSPDIFNPTQNTAVFLAGINTSALDLTDFF